MIIKVYRLLLSPKHRTVHDHYAPFHSEHQFEGQDISLDSRMGIFITMNPGYAGRTELPESVKALFRPVVVIVPDLQQICEIMLFSEGFLMAKVRTHTQHTLHCYSSICSHQWILLMYNEYHAYDILI